MKKDRRQNGFTLAELLIVVAIIAVLVAISIPIFTSQLEKSREATDMANIRSQYAQVMSDIIYETSATGEFNGDGSKYGKISLKQKKSGWDNKDGGEALEAIFGENKQGDGPNADGSAWVGYDWEKQAPVLHYEGGSASAKAKRSAAEFYPENATVEQKSDIDMFYKAYTEALEMAKNTTETWRSSGDGSYLAYYIDQEGNVKLQGGQSQNGTNTKWSNAKESYRAQSTSSSITKIDGYTVQWGSNKNID